MSALGIDIGTKNIVLAARQHGKVKFLREVNGYFCYPRPSHFVEAMLSDPNKTRSDGCKRAARWLRLSGQQGIFVVGADAEELAYAHNDTLLRPMAEGGVAQEEEALTILSAIVQGLLRTAEKEFGALSDGTKIVYATTAPALNRPLNLEYHERVIDLIVGGYHKNFQAQPIRESHALVLKESKDGTGIGISWGAGTVTVSYVLWGTDIYSFSWVGAGDWIDLEVARRHGYDSNNLQRRPRETPTTVCRRKEQIDLSKPHADRLGLDLLLHYRVLVQNVIAGIVRGFIENEDRARVDKPLALFMAGGTCIPTGFETLVQDVLRAEHLPFEVDKIVRCTSPLLAVAEGCLLAAEL